MHYPKYMFSKGASHHPFLRHVSCLRSSKIKQVPLHVNHAYTAMKGDGWIIFKDKWAQACLDLFTVCHPWSMFTLSPVGPPFSLSLSLSHCPRQDMGTPATGEAGTQVAMTVLQQICTLLQGLWWRGERERETAKGNEPINYANHLNDFNMCGKGHAV